MIHVATLSLLKCYTVYSANSVHDNTTLVSSTMYAVSVYCYFVLICVVVFSVSPIETFPPLRSLSIAVAACRQTHVGFQ